jgi:hypothetical protein
VAIETPAARAMSAMLTCRAGVSLPAAAAGRCRRSAFLRFASAMGGILAEEWKRLQDGGQSGVFDASNWRP